MVAWRCGQVVAIEGPATTHPPTTNHPPNHDPAPDTPTPTPTPTPQKINENQMTYVQALTGSGGWPMSVFLTPSLQPILGATYLPPVDRSGMPSFKTLLRRIENVWGTRREDLVAQVGGFGGLVGGFLDGCGCGMSVGV